MKKTNLIKKLWKGYLVLSTVYTGVTFLRCRGLKKEDDRHLIGKAIDRIAGYNIDADNIITIDDTDLHVSYNPYLHLFTNRLGGIALVINGTNEVYVDDNYRRLSNETQKAVLAHELGHYKLNHKAGNTYAIDRALAIFRNQVLPMELEADEYAASIVGTHSMIKALIELSSIKGISKREIKLRIKNLRNK